MKTYSFDELVHRIRFASTDARQAAAERRDGDVLLCLAACRTWANRAEYAFTHGDGKHAEISESDFVIADEWAAKREMEALKAS